MFIRLSVSFWLGFLVTSSISNDLRGGLGATRTRVDAHRGREPSVATVPTNGKDEDSKLSVQLAAGEAQDGGEIELSVE